MKRLLSTIVLFVGICLVAHAQQGLEINKLFGGKYISDPSVSEVVLSGDQPFLTKKHLSAMSTFRGDAKTYAPIIESLVLDDGKDATARNVRYKDGRLQYAFFALPPDKAKDNRFIYYINNSPGNVILIYIAGRISLSRAESIIRSLAK